MATAPPDVVVVGERFWTYKYLGVNIHEREYAESIVLVDACFQSTWQLQ